MNKKKPLTETIVIMEQHLQEMKDQIRQAIEILEASQRSAARSESTLGSALALCQGSEEAMKILSRQIR